MTLEADTGERLPGPVESAAYFVVSEALANVAKYARVAALDGTLSLDSPPGRGTRLHAEIPCAPLSQQG